MARKECAERRASDGTLSRRSKIIARHRASDGLVPRPETMTSHVISEWRTCGGPAPCLENMTSNNLARSRASGGLPPRPVTPDISQEPAGGSQFSVSPRLKNQIGPLSTEYSYELQHYVLNNVQRILEEICFEYAIRKAPGFLKMQKWRSHEAGELSKWSKQFPEYMRTLKTEDSSWIRDLGRTLKILCDLRNVAVHRQPVDARALRELLRVSITLGNLMRDELRTNHLQDVLSLFDKYKLTVERRVHMLSLSLDEEIYPIQKEKDTLNQKKWELNKMANQKILQAKKENRRLVKVAEGRMRSEVSEVFARLQKKEEIEPNLLSRTGPLKSRENPDTSKSMEIIDITGDDDDDVVSVPDPGPRTMPQETAMTLEL